MNKPILCLDFDGVIHSYTSGWKGADVIPDPPVRGALQFIVDAMKVFSVSIFSSRSNQPGGKQAMIQWLGYWSVDPEHGMPNDFDHAAWGDIEWSTEKPAAFVTIDYRALTFDGTWPDLAELKKFKPWNKREFGATGEFPRGKIDETDEGALKLGIAWDGKNGIVRVDFGKPTAWLGLPQEQAIEFAKVIMKKAGAKRIEVDF